MTNWSAQLRESMSHHPFVGTRYGLYCGAALSYRLRGINRYESLLYVADLAERSGMYHFENSNCKLDELLKVFLSTFPNSLTHKFHGRRSWTVQDFNDV